MFSSEKTNGSVMLTMEWEYLPMSDVDALIWWSARKEKSLLVCG